MHENLLNSFAHRFFPSISKQEFEVLLSICPTICTEVLANATATANESTNALTSSDEKNAKPELKRTEWCNVMDENGNCTRTHGICWYAHNEEEKLERGRNANWKTRPCDPFVVFGECNYYHRCNFFHHGEDEDKIDINGNPLSLKLGKYTSSTFFMCLCNILKNGKPEHKDRAKALLNTGLAGQLQKRLHTHSQRSNSFPAVKASPPTPASRKSIESTSSYTYGLSSSPDSSITSFASNADSSQYSLFSYSSRENIHGNHSPKSTVQSSLPPWRRNASCPEVTKNPFEQSQQQTFPFFNLNDPSSYGYTNDHEVSSGTLTHTVKSFAPFDQNCQPSSSYSKTDSNEKNLLRIITNGDNTPVGETSLTLRSPKEEQIRFPFKKYRYGK